MKPESLILGSHIVYWVILCGLALTVVGITTIFFLGGAQIRAPDTVAYIERGEVAIESPPFAAAEHLGESVIMGVRSVFEEQSPGQREEREQEQPEQEQREQDSEQRDGERWRSGNPPRWPAAQ